MTLIAAVLFSLTASIASGQGTSGPFPGSAVDSQTLKIQTRVEELFTEGEFERALLIYRNELAPIGDKYAQYMVGYMYLTGTGVQEDPVLASAWFRLAAERSYKEFQLVRDQLLRSFSEIDLIRSDSLYLQLRQQYSDVVLLLNQVKDDLDSVEPTTGSRLAGGGGTVTIVDARTGSSVSRDRMIGQINRRVEARLKFMAKQMNMPDLETDPEDVDVDELEETVKTYINTFTDRPVRD